jgi:hypothetical protein
MKNLKKTIVGASMLVGTALADTKLNYEDFTPIYLGEWTKKAEVEKNTNPNCVIGLGFSPSEAYAREQSSREATRKLEKSAISYMINDGLFNSNKISILFSYQLNRKAYLVETLLCPKSK